jgi:hypothetical protein
MVVDRLRLCAAKGGGAEERATTPTGQDKGQCGQPNQLKTKQSTTNKQQEI